MDGRNIWTVRMDRLMEAAGWTGWIGIWYEPDRRKR
jgi:hypothetical protein